MKCPICEGTKGWYEDYGLDIYYPVPWTNCPYCKGTGKISFIHWLKYKWWENIAPDWVFDLIAEITHLKETRKGVRNEEGQST